MVVGMTAATVVVGDGMVTVVVVGDAMMTVVVVVVGGSVVVVVGAGHIVSGLNLRHCRTSLARQRVNLTRRNPPQDDWICAPHADRHSILVASSRA